MPGSALPAQSPADSSSNRYWYVLVIRISKRKSADVAQIRLQNCWQRRPLESHWQVVNAGGTDADRFTRPEIENLVSGHDSQTATIA